MGRNKKGQMVNQHYFPLLLLLVITVNGAPKAAPNPKPDPKAKAQMAIIFNGGRGRGHTGQGNRINPERIYDGFEQGLSDGWGFKGGYTWRNCKMCWPCADIDGPLLHSDWCHRCKRKFGTPSNGCVW